MWKYIELKTWQIRKLISNLTHFCCPLPSGYEWCEEGEKMKEELDLSLYAIWDLLVGVDVTDSICISIGLKATKRCLWLYTCWNYWWEYQMCATTLTRPGESWLTESVLTCSGLERSVFWSGSLVLFNLQEFESDCKSNPSSLKQWLEEWLSHLLAMFTKFCQIVGQNFYHFPHFMSGLCIMSSCRIKWWFTGYRTLNVCLEVLLKS